MAPDQTPQEPTYADRSEDDPFVARASGERPHSSRLTALRHLNGLTQGDLARRMNVSQSFLSYVERDQRPFPLELAHRLSSEFRLPLVFFTINPTPGDIAPATFRKSSRASVRDEERVTAYYTEAARLFQWASRESGYHSANLPTPADYADDPELVATAIREGAGLYDEDPVTNATRLIERLGVGVIDNLDRRLDEASSAHTGISRPSQYTNRPLIAVVTADVPPAVKRLTLMHELSHLVFDKDLPAAITSTRSLEEQRAFQLAAAILLPAQAMQRRVSETLNLQGYLAIKADYGVSVGAIIRRGKELNLIGPSRYRSLSIQLSSQGWRTHEPVVVDDERPVLLKQALNRTHPTRPHQHASQTLGIPQDDIRRWTHTSDTITDSDDTKAQQPALDEAHANTMSDQVNQAHLEAVTPEKSGSGTVISLALKRGAL